MVNTLLKFRAPEALAEYLDNEAARIRGRARQASPSSKRIMDSEAAAPNLLDGCKALLGLLDLISSRDDMPGTIRNVLATTHRVEEARAAVAKAEAR